MHQSAVEQPKNTNTYIQIQIQIPSAAPQPSVDFCLRNQHHPAKHKYKETCTNENVFTRTNTHTKLVLPMQTQIHSGSCSPAQLHHNIASRQY